MFKFDGLVFNGPPAAAFANVMKTVIFPEGLVIAWLLAAPCAALVARPASPEVWSCPSPVAMPAACFVAYVYVFIGALVAFTVEVTPVAYVTSWMCTIVDFSVVVTPVAHVTVRMSSTVEVATINGALRDLGSFQSIDGSIWVFGCSLAGALGVPLNAANPGVWSGLALSMTRPCPSPYCFQSILASIFAGIENDLVQAVSPAPVFMKSFVSVDYVVSLTPQGHSWCKAEGLMN